MANPKGRGVKWIVLYVITGVVDVVQIIIDFTGFGIAVSEAIEAIMPFVLIGLLMLFRIPIFSHPKRLLSILGALVVDAATGGVAPLWIADVLYLHRDVRREDAQIEAGRIASISVENDLPLYSGGVGRPRLDSTYTPQEGETSQPRNQNTRPLNYEGVRRPSV